MFKTLFYNRWYCKTQCPCKLSTGPQFFILSIQMMTKPVFKRLKPSTDVEGYTVTGKGRKNYKLLTVQLLRHASQRDNGLLYA